VRGFLELDREIEQEALSRAPALVDGFLEAMAQRNGDFDSVVYGIQKFVVLRTFSAWGQEDFTERVADRAFAFMPNREAWRAGDIGADADLIPDEDREETLARVLMLNRSRDTQGLGFSEALRRLLSAGRWWALDIEVAMVADHAGTEDSGRLGLVRRGRRATALAADLSRAPPRGREARPLLLASRTGARPQRRSGRGAP
jgi:hypothetical protein